jgi:hypothetical protein
LLRPGWSTRRKRAGVEAYRYTVVQATLAAKAAASCLACPQALARAATK